MKKLFYSSLALLTILFAFSCKKEAPVSNVPVISFSSFTATSDLNAVLTFSFTDGDGDIGVSSGDDTKDCFIRYYYKDPTSVNYLTYYYPIDTLRTSLADSNIYAYGIPYITNNLKSKSLNGLIEINMFGYKPDFSGGGAVDTSKLNNFRFTFWIYDRAGHKSNVVTTPGFHTYFYPN